MKSGRPFELELQVQKIDLVYRQSMTAPLMMTITTAIFFYYGWNEIPHALWFEWAVPVTAASLLRIGSIVRWRQVRDRITSPRTLRRWHALLVGFLFTTGVALGALGWISVFNFGGVAQLCVGLTILGILAGSVTAYAPSLPGVIAILIPAIVLWSAGAFAAGGDDNSIVSVMVVIFGLYHLRFGFNWSRYFDRSIRMNSELHEKEGRLRLNRDSSGAIDWEWNLATNALICEGNLENLFGPGVTQFRGQCSDYLARVHPQDREAFEAAMTDGLRSGTLDAEHRVLWLDGQVQYMAVRGQVQVDGGGQPIRVNGICWNVTAKKIQDQLRHERDVYEAADKAKLIFLANASHEIRTPLAAINGFSELVLGRRDLTPDLREDVNVILRNGKHLVSIVSDLLDLSKAEAGRLFIQKAPMSPLREINDALLVVQEAARRKGLTLRKSIDTPVPECILSDVTRFRQILINLLTNAVKYTNEGGATVHVSHRTQDGKPVLRIVVADTGIGIPEETRRRLFQPFARGQGADVQKESGSGLGLALSRSLALKMGGDLRLLDAPDASKGSSFFEFTVETGPLDGVRFVTEAAAADPAAEAAPLSNILAGLKILVVDDKENLRELMRRFLSAHGAQVVCRSNGAEVVREAGSSSYDAILMDLQMPVMDGMTAMKALRAAGVRTCIVALTAHASTSDREMCENAGFNFYLSKPVDMGHLLDVLRDPAARAPRDLARP